MIDNLFKRINFPPIPIIIEKKERFLVNRIIRKSAADSQKIYKGNNIIESDGKDIERRKIFSKKNNNYEIKYRIS
jgi:hypothetical protein